MRKFLHTECNWQIHLSRIQNWVIQMSEQNNFNGSSRWIVHQDNILESSLIGQFKLVQPCWKFPKGKGLERCPCSWKRFFCVLQKKNAHTSRNFRLILHLKDGNGYAIKCNVNPISVIFTCRLIELTFSKINVLEINSINSFNFERPRIS